METIIYNYIFTIIGLFALCGLLPFIGIDTDSVLCPKWIKDLHLLIVALFGFTVVIIVFIYFPIMLILKLLS